MNDKLDSLLEKMRDLEKEMMHELRRKETEFFYDVRMKIERVRGSFENIVPALAPDS